MQPLQRFLVDYDMGLLRAVAQRRGVVLSTNRQAEAAGQLAAALLDPLSVRVALAQLSSAGRQALEALVGAGGRMRAAQFFRHFGPLRPAGPGRLEREAPWQQPANASEELFYLGLLFRAFLQDGAGTGDYVVVPSDLLGLLPQPGLPAAVVRVETAPAPEGALEGGPALVRDLFAYLVYVQNHGGRCHADGRLSRADLLALRGRLTDPDERRLALLRHLAEGLGFVVRQEGRLHLEQGPVRHWLAAAAADQVAEVQAAWRDSPTWLDLCQVPGLMCEDSTGWLRRVDPVAARRALLARLAHCPAPEWWTGASFVSAVKEADPDFLRPDGDYGSWYIRDAGSGAYLSGFEAWDQVEGRLIGDLLSGPLYWLGIVAKGAGQAGPVFQLTEAGLRLLGQGSGEAAASPPLRLAVQSDFRVELPSPANLYARFQLERFAEAESEDPCRYRITVDSIGRALGRGIQVDQVLTFLHQASERPLPANVVGQMRLWAGRFDQVRLEEVVLLRVKEERVLKELSVLPETRPLLGRILSPTSALVRKGDADRLRKELRTLGYLRAEGEESSES